MDNIVISPDRNAHRLDTPHFDAVIKFMEGVNRKIARYWDDNQFTFSPAPKVGIHNVGKRYARIGRFEKRGNSDPSCGSVYCFLDIATGDLHKGNWKAPVKNGKRGNVNDPDVLNRFTEHGPAYLR
jgi:hypothetical protein